MLSLRSRFYRLEDDDSLARRNPAMKPVDVVGLGLRV